MTDSRDLDWDQGVDRHSVLPDPVVTVRTLSRFNYRRNHSRIDNALVFTTVKGGLEAWLPPRRPSRSECAAKRYTAVYEVDMGVHHCTASLLLPSDNDAFDFTSALETTWQVTLPGRFVASGVRDVPALLTRRLEELMRPVSRDFPIDRSAAAERAVRQVVTDAGSLADDVGLRVTWTIRLRRDDDAIDHQRELRRIRYSDEELVDSHDLAMREDRLKAERDNARARQGHELAMLQYRQEAELRKLEAEKIRYYQYYLQHGGVATWALHLAQHPEDSRLVMENLRADQLALIKSQTEVALEVLKGEDMEDYQRSGLNKQAVQIIEELLTHNLPGAAPAPPELGSLSWGGNAGPAEPFREPAGHFPAEAPAEGA
ncbi:PE-PGRS family protein [Streptomyces sp. NPDC047108]|uniref:PE-PGRS family protein n=1 Tax=Streptomyces sp. NPDC047108 TaxID=3155025 RepID=UPI0033EC9C91